MCDLKAFVVIGCLLSVVVARPQFSWEDSDDYDDVSNRQQQQWQQRPQQRPPPRQPPRQPQGQPQGQQPPRQPGFNPGNPFIPQNAGNNAVPTPPPAPTTPAPANAVTTPSPQYLACLQSCPTTSEYNPVCGSDAINYHNNGRLQCARNCGKNVAMVRMGTCRPLS